MVFEGKSFLIVGDSMESFWHKYIANSILAFAALTFLLTYPFQDNWWLALIGYTAGAATIGGLADWYAITALFRKPLGISFKTALIPRSRDRVVETARYMVEKELLTVPHMYRVLKENPPLMMGLSYIRSETGQQVLFSFIERLGDALARSIDGPVVLKALEQLEIKAIERLSASQVLAHILRCSLSNGTAAGVCRLIAQSLAEIAATDKVRNWIELIYEQSAEDYIKRDLFRGFIVRAALSSDTFRPAAVAILVQNKIVELCEDIEDSNSPRYKALCDWLWKWADRLDQDKELQSRVERWKLDLFAKTGWKYRDLALYSERFLLADDRRRGARWLCTYLVQQAQQWQKNEIAHDRINRYILGVLVDWLYYIQPKLGVAVEQEVSKYSGEQLAALVENKVYYDLQMIRVNGSVVGGLLGAVIFLGLHVMKGGW